MKARISVLTLGVSDLERSLAFYRDGLGLPTEGIIGQEFEYGAVAFFNLQQGLVLALWPRTSIARDAGLAEGPPSATEFTLAHNVNSKAEVDVVLEQAARAGARVVKAPSDCATRTRFEPLPTARTTASAYSGSPAASSAAGKPTAITSCPRRRSSGSSRCQYQAEPPAPGTRT